MAKICPFCLRGILSLGHVVSRGRLSPGHIVSGADCLRGTLSRGVLFPEHIISGHIVLGHIVPGRIFSGHHVPPPKCLLQIVYFKTCNSGVVSLLFFHRVKRSLGKVVNRRVKEHKVVFGSTGIILPVSNANIPMHAFQRPSIRPRLRTVLWQCKFSLLFLTPSQCFAPA